MNKQKIAHLYDLIGHIYEDKGNVNETIKYWELGKIFMQKLAMRMALSPLSYTKVHYMIIIVIMIKLLNIN